jgi:hypothetical protein
MFCCTVYLARELVKLFMITFKTLRMIYAFDTELFK